MPVTVLAGEVLSIARFALVRERNTPEGLRATDIARFEKLKQSKSFAAGVTCRHCFARAAQCPPVAADGRAPRRPGKLGGPLAKCGPQGRSLPGCQNFTALQPIERAAVA